MFPILHTKNTQNIRSKSRYFVLLQAENKLDFKLLKHITIMAKKALLMILDGRMGLRRPSQRRCNL